MSTTSVSFIEKPVQSAKLIQLRYLYETSLIGLDNQSGLSGGYGAAASPDIQTRGRFKSLSCYEAMAESSIVCEFLWREKELLAPMMAIQPCAVGRGSVQH